MKVYCEKCKKVFEAEKPAEGNEVTCEFCKEKVPFPESSSSPGAVIGDFLIEKEISRGGMGVVFLARQLSLERSVALKILQTKFLDDKEYVESFFREARAAGRINHPNVVQAYAVGEENGIFYFAMEYIRGKTMKEILKEDKTIEPRKAAKIIQEVAGALECAWRDEKLVHQDIKPDNIMLDANGFAKLADLGLARVAGTNDKESCEGDEVLGTPQYISPEQLTGVPTDVRSDIYSLGATFYQFLTGRFPYVADTAEELAKLHVAGHLQPPKEVNPAIPDELNTIIMKMMARNIEDRYQTPAPLVKALEMYLQHSAPGAGGSAVPQLKFRLPSAGGAAAATPGAKSPFTPGAKSSPFAGGGAASGLPKATPPKPVAPPAVPKATPPPKSAVPSAVAKAHPPKPVVPPGAAGEAAALKPAESKPASTGEAKPAAGEELALKAVPKPEPTPPPAETKEEPGKKGKKGEKGGKAEKEKKSVGKLILMVLATLLLVAITLGFLVGAVYFLAVGDKLPGAVKPYGDKLVALIRGEAPPQQHVLNIPSRLKNPEEGTGTKTDPKQESPKPPAETPKPPEPPKPPVDPTRPDYLKGIDALLEKIQSNPDDRIGFLEECDRFFLKFPNPISPREWEALRPLLNAYHRVDEVARVAPARALARAEFRKGLEARQKADEAVKKELAAKLEAERQKKAQAEAQAKQLAEEKAQQEAEKKAAAEARLAQIRPQLQLLFGKVANSFLTSARTGNAAAFDRDMATLRDFQFTPGNTPEEIRLLTQINAFMKDLPGEQKTLRAFVERLGQITPSKDSFSMEMPNRDLLTVVRVTPDSVTAIDGTGKPAPFDLTDPRVRGLFLRRIEGRLKLAKPALSLDLMTGNFTPETAKAASQNSNFWKAYYKPFLTAYFIDRLTNAGDAEKQELEKRCGKLPEFQAAQTEVRK